MSLIMSSVFIHKPHRIRSGDNKTRKSRGTQETFRFYSGNVYERAPEKGLASDTPKPKFNKSFILHYVPQHSQPLRLYYVRMDRRIARNQDLPDIEGRVLRVTHGNSLINRAQDLYDAGWTLRAIGEQLDPPRSRSTVSRWVHRSRESGTDTPGLPVPTPPAYTRPPRERKRPVSPGISAADQITIHDLAPIARRYRSRLSPDHPAAKANQDLSNLCRRLYRDGVRIQELADAAGVSHTAMSKRVKDA